jgi:hypothetical protein
VAPDKVGLARSAVDLLRARIADTSQPARDLQVHFDLAARESTLGSRVT